MVSGRILATEPRMSIFVSLVETENQPILQGSIHILGEGVGVTLLLNTHFYHCNPIVPFPTVWQGLTTFLSPGISCPGHVRTHTSA